MAVADHSNLHHLFVFKDDSLGAKVTHKYMIKVLLRIEQIHFLQSMCRSKKFKVEIEFRFLYFIDFSNDCSSSLFGS